MSLQQLLEFKGKLEKLQCCTLLNKYIELSEKQHELYEYGPTIDALNIFVNSIKEFNEKEKLILGKALLFALQKHYDQWYDWKNNKKTPYTYHITSVAVNVQKFSKSIPVIITALWHDLLEDADVTKEELNYFLEKNKLPNIIPILEKLDRKKAKNAEEYYKKILQDEIAIQVKSADLLSNLNVSLLRLQEMLSTETRFWIYKYIAEINQYILPIVNSKKIREVLTEIASLIVQQLQPEHVEELNIFSKKYIR